MHFVRGQFLILFILNRQFYIVRYFSALFLTKHSQLCECPNGRRLCGWRAPFPGSRGLAWGARVALRPPTHTTLASPCPLSRSGTQGPPLCRNEATQCDICCWWYAGHCGGALDGTLCRCWSRAKQRTGRVHAPLFLDKDSKANFMCFSFSSFFFFTGLVCGIFRPFFFIMRQLVCVFFFYHKAPLCKCVCVCVCRRRRAKVEQPVL